MQAVTNHPTLQQGSQGLKVKELQELLNRRVSFNYKVDIDGIFGSKTKEAVKVFQYSKLLRRDGIVGPKTWKALLANDSIADVPVPYLRRNSQGEDVMIVQDILKAVSLYKGSIDGDFGALTEAAVKTFQGQRELPMDGIVGLQTWQAMSGVAAFMAFD
ncbi:peptidoglycan-binding protein [Phormidium tenue FACHB-886]|nr:peptidoglycan-binding protein [Phormidium tenue FACHB-886]